MNNSDFPTGPAALLGALGLGALGAWAFFEKTKADRKVVELAVKVNGLELQMSTVNESINHWRGQALETTEQLKGVQLASRIHREDIDQVASIIREPEETRYPAKPASKRRNKNVDSEQH